MGPRPGIGAASLPTVRKGPRRTADCLFGLATFAIREYSMCMAMKSQDIFILLGLCLPDRRDMTYAQLADTLCMSASEVHASVQRSVDAGMLSAEERCPIFESVMEFLVHGLKYVYPAVRGQPTRGLLTMDAASVVDGFLSNPNELPPVWPFSGEGTMRGITFEPLYPKVPFAAKKDTRLYALLAYADTLRGGRARERKWATVELDKALRRYLEVNSPRRTP